MLDLSGVTHMIWLEGINDFSKNGNAPLEKVTDAIKEVIGRVRGKAPQIRIIGATVTTALGSSSTAHGFPEQDQKRRALNEFIRTSGLFDGVIDFDKATLDPRAVGSSPNSCPRVHRRSGRQAAPQTALAISLWEWRSISTCSS